MDPAGRVSPMSSFRVTHCDRNTRTGISAADLLFPRFQPLTARAQQQHKHNLMESRFRHVFSSIRTPADATAALTALRLMRHHGRRGFLGSSVMLVDNHRKG